MQTNQNYKESIVIGAIVGFAAFAVSSAALYYIRKIQFNYEHKHDQYQPPISEQKAEDHIRAKIELLTENSSFYDDTSEEENNLASSSNVLIHYTRSKTETLDEASIRILDSGEM